MHCYYVDLNMSDFVNVHSEFNPQKSTFLVDSQADISIFKVSSIQNSNIFINSLEKVNIKGITNHKISSLGLAYAYLYFNNFDLQCQFHIVSDEFEIPADGILGKDFLKNNNCQIDYNNMSISINNHNQKEVIPLIEGPNNGTFALPARAEVTRKILLNIAEDTVIMNQEIVSGVYIPRILVSENPVVRILNTNSQSIIIPKNLNIETKPLSDFQILNVFPISKDPDSNKTRTEELLNLISKNVAEPYKDDLLTLSKQFPEIFLL